jgi:SAM-dependent methyltransferase
VEVDMVDAEKINEIKRYWEDKAEEYETRPQATTSDYWVRQVEIRHLTEEILKYGSQGCGILDIGCGNGYSTIELVKRLPSCRFIGVDYAPRMIRYANEAKAGLSNALKERLTFFVDDVLSLEGDYKDVEVVITDRCLINLPSFELQKQAISSIARILPKGARCLLAENFMEGHNNFNRLRKSIGLKEIPVRWHNLFFNESSFEEAVADYFDIVEVRNISSLYYLATRVIYSKVCSLENREPDYDNIIYQVGAELPVEGDYGPIKLAILNRR